MTAKVIELDDYRPIWKVEFVRCDCGNHHIGTMPEGVNTTKLECPKCGGFNAYVVSEDEWKISRHAQNPVW